MDLDEKLLPNGFPYFSVIYIESLKLKLTWGYLKNVKQRTLLFFYPVPDCGNSLSFDSCFFVAQPQLLRRRLQRGVLRLQPLFGPHRRPRVQPRAEVGHPVHSRGSRTSSATMLYLEDYLESESLSSFSAPYGGGGGGGGGRSVPADTRILYV